jgi:hypothetical protein
VRAGIPALALAEVSEHREAHDAQDLVGASGDRAARTINPGRLIAHNRDSGKHHEAGQGETDQPEPAMYVDPADPDKRGLR